MENFGTRVGGGRGTLMYYASSTHSNSTAKTYLRRSRRNESEKKQTLVELSSDLGFPLHTRLRPPRRIKYAKQKYNFLKENFQPRQMSGRTIFHNFSPTSRCIYLSNKYEKLSC